MIDAKHLLSTVGVTKIGKIWNFHLIPGENILTDNTEQSEPSECCGGTELWKINSGWGGRIYMKCRTRAKS